MKTKGRNSKLITAYAALATVAIGVVTFDFTQHTTETSSMTSVPVLAFTAPSPSAVPTGTQKAVTTKADATLPKAGPATVAKSGKRVAVANYTGQHPPM
jgi:hypothetical protein